MDCMTPTIDVQVGKEHHTKSNNKTMIRCGFVLHELLLCIHPCCNAQFWKNTCCKHKTLRIKTVLVKIKHDTLLYFYILGWEPNMSRCGEIITVVYCTVHRVSKATTYNMTADIQIKRVSMPWATIIKPDDEESLRASSSDTTYAQLRFSSATKKCYCTVL